MWEECPIRSDQNSRENKSCSLLLRKKCTLQTVSCASEITPPMRTASMYLIIPRLWGGNKEREREREKGREKGAAALFAFSFTCSVISDISSLSWHTAARAAAAPPPMLQVSDCTAPHLDGSTAAHGPTGWMTERAALPRRIQVSHHP